MICFVREDSEDYTLSFSTADVNIICNQEKGVPQEWITQDGSDVGEAFITYAKPLIRGKVEVPTLDGLPNFAYRK